MSYWIINISIVFLLCVVICGIIIPKVLLISFEKKLFDVPDERKIHRGVVPRLGGIAFQPAIFIAIAITMAVNLSLGYDHILRLMEDNVLPFSFGYCSLMVLYIVGIGDDLVGVRYRSKFVVQIFCSLMFIEGGLYIDNLHGFLGIYYLPIWIAYLLTVLMVVFTVNAINLIDGIDGLASGLSSVALLIYGFAFIALQRYVCAMVAFATLGVLVPFFYYNVFGDASHRKKIFMGDTGSLSIGLILIFLAIRLLQTSGGSQVWIANPLVLAFTPLIVPCFDVVRVFMHRIRRHHNPFLPDKSHIHHKLLALGMPQRLAMVSIVGASLVYCSFNILIARSLNINWLILINVASFSLANIWMSCVINKKWGGVDSKD